MIHLGDITKINGDEIPLVDVITGGSPCQDLSVAGNRAGLAGERSGLFMEMIRIIKEMRDATIDNGHLPRFMVWENVPGALSSNNGEDFRAVLEETARIAEPDAVIPRPDRKWSNSGCIMGRGWSIAWRIHDAQFWGVPQRRRRIALIADFAGSTAPEILFERKSVFGHPTESGEEGQGTAAGTEGSPGASSYTLKIRGGVERDSYGKKAGKGPLIQEEKSATLGVSQDQTLFQDVAVDLYNQSMTGGVAATLNAATGASANHSGPTVMAVNARNSTENDVNGALQAECKKNVNSNNVIRIGEHH